MRKTFTLLIALMALTVCSWATPTTITWNAENGLTSINLNEYTNNYWENEYHSYNDGTKTAIIEGIVASISATTDGSSASFYTYSGTSISISNGATLTFSSGLYEIQSIVINFTSSGYATGWTSNGSTLTWTGNATHSVEMADAYVSGITSIVFTVEAVPTTTVEWDGTDVSMVSLSCSDIDEVQTASKIDGITASLTKISSGDNCQFSSSEIWFSNACGKVTFTSSVGNIISIVITCGTVWNHYDLSGGWTFNGEANTLTWEGTASNEVILSGGIDFMVSSIEFIIDASAPAPATTTTTITWEKSDIINLGDLVCNNVDQTETANAIDGITFSITKTSAGETCKIYNQGDLWITNCGEATFTSTVGNITKIVITHSDKWNTEASTGWIHDDEAKTFTWQGTPSSAVTISGNIDFVISSIEFTVESAAAPVDPTPANQGPVTWDFANDAELKSIYLTQYTQYNFGGYYQEYYDNHYDATVKDFKGIVATISAMIDGSYASFSTQNNYSIDLSGGGTLSFSTDLGQFQSIVVNTNGGSGRNSGDWKWDLTEKTLTWSGTPSDSVVLDNIYVNNITSIVFTFVSAAPAFTADITWDATEVASISLYGSSFNTVVSSSEIDGITPSIMKTNDGYCYFDNSKIKMQNNGELIFTSSVGDIQGIVLTFDNTDSYSISDFPVGWILNEVAGTLTWEGTAADEVSLSGNISCTVTSIEFEVDPSTAPLIPTGPYFEWLWRQVNLVELYCTGLNEVQKTNVIKNVITSLQRTVVNSDYCYFQNGSIKLVDNGELTFKSIVGDFTSIVITGSAYTDPTNLPANWAYNSTAGTLTWMGTPAEQVTLSGDIDINNISSIKFFYDPAPAPYVGTKFFGIYNQWYEITGAHTAKMPAQTINHTLDVPASVEYENETYYVTEIADNAFKNNVDLPNTYIGANVARIGAHAFEGCYRMDEVTVNSTVLESIGDEAFKNCQLMHIFECSTNLPPELGSDVFYGDTRINHYNVLSSYVVDRYKAADGWSALADKIYLIFGEPAIGEVFFWNNQMTTNLYAVAAVSPEHEAKVLPYTVNDLYPRTLSGRLTIPEEVRYMNKDYDVAVIGADAYKDATLIDFVLIPQAVKTIEAGAFSGCTGVTNVQFLWDDLTGITWADGNVGAEFATPANTKICVPMGKLEVYMAWAPAWASCMVEGELLDIDVTNSQDPDHVGRYYRTFYDSQTDYLLPPSVWAHAGYVDGESFVLRPVAFDGMILPRRTAVVLESETPTYRLIPVGNDAPLYAGPNDLIGTDVSIPRTSVGNNGENVYVLGKQATVGGSLQVGMGMYRYTGEYLGAHKAYMIVGGTSGAPTRARFLFRHEDETTDIENVQENNATYTKILRNGQLIILKDGKEYNTMGQIVK